MTLIFRTDKSTYSILGFEQHLKVFVCSASVSNKNCMLSADFLFTKTKPCSLEKLPSLKEGCKGISTCGSELNRKYAWQTKILIKDFIKYLTLSVWYSDELRRLRTSKYRDAQRIDDNTFRREQGVK